MTQKNQRQKVKLENIYIKLKMVLQLNRSITQKIWKTNIPCRILLFFLMNNEEDKFLLIQALVFIVLLKCLCICYSCITYYIVY
jgi:hypothetical protein